MSNAPTAFYFNVSFPGNAGPRNTSNGAEFSLGDTLGTYNPDLKSIKIDKINGGYLDLSLSPTNRTG